MLSIAVPHPENGLRRASRIAARVGRGAPAKHSAGVEIAVLTALYAVYEVVRGVRHASARPAVAHALDIVSLERGLHVYVEGGVQHALEHVTGLLTALAFAYPLLHVVGTLGILTWVYRSRPAHYPTIRTTLVAITGMALVVYVVFPVAPPRLAPLGIRDTVSDVTPLNLSSTVLGRFYNPFAAVPSLHFAYALLMGSVLVVLSHRRAARAAGALLPVVTLFAIVATGNHFFADAAAGGGVAALGLAVAVGICSSPLRQGHEPGARIREFPDGAAAQTEERTPAPSTARE